MNLLYISLINLEKNLLGVNKKIEGQIKAIKKQGLNTYRIALKNSGLYAFNNDEEVLLKKTFSGNKFEFIQKRIIYYRIILNFIKKHDIKVIYIRYLLSDPFFINFIKECKRIGAKVYLEVATYPYEKEINILIRFIDNFFRKFLRKYVDYIITYSDHRILFGINTINIENGIDTDSIKISKLKFNKDIINFIGVASISRWHGFDRVIKGIAEYYKKNDINKKIFFHVVGEGPELSNLKILTKKLNLEKYVVFHGFKSGRELDEIFDRCNIGIGSLGNHRKGINKDSALKNREYCARGVPFVIASLDNDFSENFKYVFRVPKNEENVNVQAIVEFYNSIRQENYVNEMRKYAKERLSWDAKMKPVIKTILDIKSYNN